MEKVVYNGDPYKKAGIFDYPNFLLEPQLRRNFGFTKPLEVDVVLNRAYGKDVGVALFLPQLRLAVSYEIKEGNLRVALHGEESVVNENAQRLEAEQTGILERIAQLPSKSTLI